MKKTLLFSLFTLLFSTALLAQYQVTNSGFETFEKDNLNGVGVTPSGWNASNVRRTVLGFTASGEMVKEEKNGRNGSCVYIFNTKVGAAGIEETAPGWITLGKPWNYLSGVDPKTATAGTDGGIKFTARPDTVALWIKRTYSQAENAHIVFYSWKGTSRGDSYKTKGGSCGGETHYDEESDIRQQFDGNTCGTAVPATQIAEAMWRSSEQFNDWTEIKVPIRYISNDVPEKMNIIISCANYPNLRDSKNIKDGSKLWADDLRLIYSSAVHEVLLNGMPMKGFDCGVYTYSYSLGASATDVPEITLKRSGRELNPSEYTIKKGGLGEETVITVNAEDGSSSTTYTITFVGVVSKNANPADILIGGESLKSYNPKVYEYDVELPFGTTACPDITITEAEDGQTYTVKKPASLPGTAVVTVTAPDGTTTQNYTLRLKVGALTDNTLTEIKVNGKAIPGYKPTTNNYTVFLPTGTVDNPTITYTSQYPEHQDIVVDNKGIDGGATISVTPKGTTLTRIYRLKFVVAESTYSYLESIKIDGVEIEGFTPENLNYSISLPLGTTQMPVIAWVKGDEFQDVKIEEGGLNGTTKIIVTAESGATSIYRLAFSTAMSDNATLKDIKVNGVSVPGFDPAVTSYKVDLPSGTAETPEVTYVKGDEYQTVQVNNGGLNGITRLIVKAQAGNRTTYSVEISVPASSNSTLNDILLDGVSLENFNPNTTDYTVRLPRGTTQLPVITWVKGDATQTVDKREGGVNGETRITVRSQTGSVTVYRLNFQVDASSDATLKSIKVGGVAIENFDPNTFAYTIELPSGTIDMPAIECEKNDPAQTITVSRGNIDEPAIITVHAEDGSTQRYTINFTVLKSENALLNMIYVDGKEMPDFDPSTMNYTVNVTKDTERCPAITVDKADGQQVSITMPYLTGKAVIVVTPEFGDKNIYIVNVTFPQSSETRLAEITLDGVAVDGFNADTYDYTITLPAGTTALPAIGYRTMEPNQKVYVETNGINGTTKLTVAAESGDTKVYTLNFTTLKSSLSTLADIKVDGATISGFAPETKEYRYLLPSGAAVAPQIGYTKADSGQAVTLSTPELSGVAIIEVVSEDKSSITTYTIEFVPTKSSDVSLSDIFVNGTPIADELFVDGIANISWNPANGMPYVTCTPSSDRQAIIIADAGYKGTDIIVVAEDGTEYFYSVNFDIVKSSAATLDDIKIYDASLSEFVSLPDFSADVDEYNYTINWRESQVPVISPVPGHSGQTVTIGYGKPNTPTVINVTAEDGVATAVYTINFETEKSSIATLSDILANGESLGDFEPEKFDYTISLPYGTTRAPQMSFKLGTTLEGLEVYEQTVEYHAAPLDEKSYFVVTAEDGTQNRYTIHFEVARSGKPNNLLAISFGNYEVSGIAEGVYDYEITLPYGTVEMPEITVAKQYDAQNVVIMQGILGGRTVIDVYADDPTVRKTTYNIDVKVETLNPLSLASLSVDGTPVPGFNATDTVYVMNVASVPQTYEPVAQSDAQFVDLVELNSSMLKLKVSDIDNNEKNYTVYFHYPADVIPNADFSQWSGTKYNGAQKPTGWTAPADCAKEYGSNTIFTKKYSTGHEVQNLGDGVVKLYTFGHWNSIAGSIPGMMTIGNMSVELKSRGNSKSSVSGGIDFRNTPEKLTMEYNPISSKNIGNWRLLVTMSDGTNSKESLFTQNYSNKNSWATAELPIDYTGLTGVSKMNVTINSANTEQASDLGFIANQEKISELQVRNLQLYYSNRLSMIYVDGNPIEGFNANTKNYFYTLDADYQGTPSITLTGEVADQAHRVNWISPIEAVITVTAEDGSEFDYKVTFIRSQSANTALKVININGVQLNGFASETTEYTYIIKEGSVNIPDVQFIPSSQYQIITSRIEDNKVVAAVTAENGDSRTYTINLEREKTNNAALNNVTLENHPDFVFDPATESYSVELAEDETMPVIVIEKQNDCQTVDVTYAHSGIKIVTKSSDLTSSKTYAITFVGAEIPTSSLLNSLAINHIPVEGFAPDKFDYHVTANVDQLVEVNFTTGSVNDIVSQIVTSTAVAIEVKGDVENVYTINIDRIHSTSVVLDNLMADNETLDGFMPDEIDYSYDYNYDRTLELRAEIENNATLTPRVEIEGGKMTAVMFDAESEDLSARQTTTIVINDPADRVALLKNILLDGEPLAAVGGNYTASASFDPETFAYTVTVNCGNPKLALPAIPDVSVVKGSDSQSVAIESGAYESDTYITVTSKSGVQQVYAITFNVELSDNARLSDLSVNYSTIDGFDPDNYEYTLKLNSGEEPVITYTKGDMFQSVSVEQSDREVLITVTAENGDENTYRIHLERVVDTTTTLAAIYQDGVEIENFNPDNYIYGPYELPIGTTELPTITAIAAANGQSVEIVEQEGETSIKVVVTAPDRVSTAEYQILYNIPLSTYNRLSMIYVDGVELEGFDPETMEYVYEMELGRTEFPEITATRGDRFQTVAVNNDTEGVALITVSPQTPDMEALYTVRCHLNLSDNALLNQLEVNGMMIDDFDPEIFDYVVCLPAGTTGVPVVSWVEGDQWQSVYYKSAVDLKGLSKIIVTSQSKENVNVYSVRFDVGHSDITTLKTILVDDVPLDDFASDKYEYNIMLPFGTTEMPEITWDLGDKNQTVEIIKGDVNGRTIIIVKADNGDEARYILNFSVEKSHNSYLKSILLRGKLIDGFDPEIFEYTVVMPYDADDDDIPSIMYELAEPQKQIAQVTVSETLADPTSIKVIAEDGVTSSTYQISFVKEKCDISLLAGIQIGGEQLTIAAAGFKADKNFDSEEFIYNVVLPRGTETLPEITYTGVVENYSSVDIEGDDINGQTVIRVTSENEYNVSEYYINFSVGKSTEARLKSISIDGKTVADFDSNIYQYTIVYPIGTDSIALPKVENITYEKLDECQNVAVSQTDAAEIILTITAEDGTTKEVYVLNFEILQSNNTLLKDILVNGVSLNSFSPTQYEYTYLLYPGAALPTLEGIKAEDSQTVYVTMGMVNEKSTIFVEAADGTTGRYTVLFKTTDTNPGLQPNLNDVAFVELGGGDFLATSTRNNVKITIFTPDGLRVMQRDVELVDANETIGYRPTTGTVLHFDHKRQIYIYVFTYNNDVVTSGKFVW